MDAGGDLLHQAKSKNKQSRSVESVQEEESAMRTCSG